MRSLTAIALAIAGLACSKSKEAPPAPPAEKEAKGHEHGDHEHEELPRRLTPSAQVIKDARIRTAPATREAITATLSLSGEIAADPDHSARISSPVAGRIAQVRFREGARIRKGEVLASVQIPDLGKLRAAHVAALAKATAARANMDRLATLVEKGLGSRQELQTAQAEATAHEADARAVGEQIANLGAEGERGGRLDLRAPIGGIVIERTAILGQPVTPEQTLGTLADLSEVWFVGRVFEKDLSRVQVGARADVVLGAHSGEHFTGKIDAIGRQVDAVARTVTARIRLRNRSDILRVGLFGSARIEPTGGGAARTALVVPQAAVTDLGGRSVVFVREGDAFEMHDVVLGQVAVGKVEVLSGIKVGELVVVDGAFSLKSMVLRGTLEEDEH